VPFPAGERAKVLQEILRAKFRFRLPKDRAVFSRYEAGRDGFWLDRLLRRFGIKNRVVDSSSIEVNRLLRRAKADSLDAASLVLLLIRHCVGEDVWSTVTVPSPADES
jgi:transposase